MASRAITELASPCLGPTKRTRATLDTTGPTFGAFLLGVIIIVGGLIYLPMLILRPIAECIVG
jgi:K+-transporting ATPase A subunit